MAKRCGMFVMMVLTAAGCAATKPDAPEIPPIEPPVSPAADAAMSSPAAATPAPATIIGYSVQHRPIQLYTFSAGGAGGAGPRPVLVMAAIHGNEPTSFEIARGLVGELSRHPRSTAGVAVVVIPVANPDGLAAGTRVNAHHIDCNRNFPASNFSARAKRMNNFGGGEAGSEPETVAIMQTIERYQPRLIISVHSMDEPCNNYDGPAERIAELMSRCNGYPTKSNIGYPTPGSLGSWAGIDRQIPMITLELPRALPGSKAWPNNRSAVLGAIAAVR